MDKSNSVLHPDRLFPADAATRTIARELYETVKALPIVSPHGHTEPSWFADDKPFEDASALLVIPDHYVFRMLHSVGIDLDDLGIPRLDGKQVASGRDIWRVFARNYHLFRGTPSHLWIDQAMSAVLDCDEPLTADNADKLYDHISEQLAKPEFRPRALFHSMGLETIATTESALDPLNHHKKLADDGWIGKVRTTYRPDSVTDPELPEFHNNLMKLGEITGCDVVKWDGMIDAHRKRRAIFRNFGATATDHGTPTAFTADFPLRDRQFLLDRALSGQASPMEAEWFRGQMLTEMAGLSIEDGMVMQIHAGSRRNTNRQLFEHRGVNMGSDIPTRIDWVGGLSAMLDKFGNNPLLNILLFTLDETTYSRELAPMVGHWKCLKIGPPWWFHDSPNGIRRYLDQVVETAGFANLAGFNDDTRALLSIPARHDVWRREVCRFLAQLIVEHRISMRDAEIVARALSYDNAKKAYKL